MPIEGLFLLLVSIQAQIIVKGIRRNETATIKTVRKKTIETDVTEEILWRGASLSRIFCNEALVNFYMNLPTADKIKQTGTTCLEELVPRNHNIIFD